MTKLYEFLTAKILYCGVSNICKSEVYDNNSINDGMAIDGIILL